MAFYNERSDRSNFVMSWTGDPKNDFSVFVKGYKSAADSLANALLARARFSDYEAYPVVFLYRHALELSLKHVVYRCAELGALRYVSAINDELQNYHDLVKLLNAAEACLRLLFPTDQTIFELTFKARQICLEFAAIDPISFTFRYPMDKRGRYPTKPHLVLNLGSIATVVTEILEEFDTVSFGLGCEIDIAQDAVYEALHAGLTSSETP